MESRERAAWLATVLASFRGKARKGPKMPKPGDRVRDGNATAKAGEEMDISAVSSAPTVEGNAVGSSPEVQAWLEHVVKKRTPRGPA